MNFTRRIRHLALLLVICSEVALLAGCGPKTERESPTPTPWIVVEAHYPGASATVVAETVAAPLEQQVNGLLGLVRMESLSLESGQYTLRLRFKAGTNLPAAIVAVQNRVAQALPQLPDEVQRAGTTVSQRSPEPVVILFLAETRAPVVDLVRDELARIPGIEHLAVLGRADVQMRIWLDPDRLAARNLTSADVVRALREQNVQVAAGAALTIGQVDSRVDPKALEGLVVKNLGEGKVIRLRDLARIEEQSTTGLGVRCNGRPGVAIAIYTAETSKNLKRALSDRLVALRARLPQDMQLEVAVDFTDRANLARLDLALPVAASEARIHAALVRQEKALKENASVMTVLALPADPVMRALQQPHLLLQLKPDSTAPATRDDTLRSLRQSVAPTEDARTRLFLLNAPPLDLAIAGADSAVLRDLTRRVGERLEASKKVRDVWRDATTEARSQLTIEIDREQVQANRVAMEDLFQTLHVALGSANLQTTGATGRTMQAQITLDLGARMKPDDLRQLQVRGGEGQRIPLGKLLKVQQTLAPQAIQRRDLQSVVRLSVSPAAGVSLRQVLAECEAEFATIHREMRLGKEYTLQPWRELPDGE